MKRTRPADDAIPSKTSAKSAKGGSRARRDAEGVSDKGEMSESGYTPQRVDLSIVDTERRPLAGADVFSFLHTYSLERMQVIELLALPTPAAFTQVCGQEDKPLPHALEMLLRWHMLTPPQSRRVTPKEVFDKIYAPILEQFEGSESYDTARQMLQERFAALFGNTVYSAYRWLRLSPINQTYGEASPPIRRLLQMIPQDPGPMRVTLERLARVTWSNRGVDFERQYPIPNPSNPPAPRRAGPQRDLKAQRIAQLQSFVTHTPAEVAVTAGKKPSRS